MVPLSQALGVNVGSKLSPSDQKLYERTDEVLHYIWDPCCISDTPAARDEYYSYLPHVFSLLKHGATAKEIADYLADIDTRQIGGGSDAPLRAQRAAEILDEWRDHLSSQS
jgi:hypothetical protein